VPHIVQPVTITIFVRPRVEWLRQRLIPGCEVVGHPDDAVVHAIETIAEPGVWTDDALLQTTRCHDDLEYGARGILAGDRLVEHGQQRIVEQRCICLSGDALRKEIVVIAGKADQCQDLAASGIQRNDHALVCLGES